MQRLAGDLNAREKYFQRELVIISRACYGNRFISTYVCLRRPVEVHCLVELGVERAVYRFRSHQSAHRRLLDGQYVEPAEGVGIALDVHRHQAVRTLHPAPEALGRWVISQEDL